MSNAIRALLDGRLNTLTPVIPVAWPNVPFTPVKGTAYHRVNLLPATPEQRELGATGRNTETGVYQVDCVFPADAGAGNAWARAELVRAHFKRGTKLAGSGFVVTIRGAGPGPAIQEDGWYVVPVTISYYAYTAN